MSQRLTGVFFHWLPLGVTVIGLSALIFGGLQQTHRSHLNDPQVQMATDGARAIAAGKTFADISANIPQTDLSKDLGPFIGLYDATGNPLDATGRLDNQLPKPPAGVFDSAAKLGKHIVSWQPTDSTRIALVIIPVPNDSHQFIAAGRNMREEEARIQSLTVMTGLGMIIVLIASFIADVIGDSFRRKMIEKTN